MKTGGVILTKSAPSLVEPINIIGTRKVLCLWQNLSPYSADPAFIEWGTVGYQYRYLLLLCRLKSSFFKMLFQLWKQRDSAPLLVHRARGSSDKLWYKGVFPNCGVCDRSCGSPLQGTKIQSHCRALKSQKIASKKTGRKKTQKLTCKEKKESSKNRLII